MDYEKLIEQLREHTTEWTDTVYGYAGLRLETATAIETLRADLARVTAERDAAVEAVKKWLNTSSAPGELTIICATKYPKSTT